MTDVYDHIRREWCSLCDEPHEPCEDEYECLDWTQDDWHRHAAFVAAEDDSERGNTDCPS